MALYVVTPFRINGLRTLKTIWKKRISLRYWCRECGQEEQVEVDYGQDYPQFLCKHCQTKNIINLKYS